MKQFITEAVGAAEFDEQTFHDKVDRIDLTGTYEATLYRKDGSVVRKTWERTPKKGYPHTEEFKAAASKRFKEYWANKNQACGAIKDKEKNQ